MPPSLEHYHRDVISGRRRGAAGSLLRGVLRIAEPVYSAVTLARNSLYNARILPAHRAGRPVISVGNITTGGTGKTPVVSWLVKQLQAAGRTPAVLMRGYRSRPGEAGDEQRLLQDELPGVIIQANPDRVAGAKRVLERDPNVNIFVLDDGFQHRRLARDFDLVLIDATNPFGFDHVLPRGLRREPLSGLKRASAFLITHAELASADALEAVEHTLWRYNPEAPVFRSEHAQTGLRDAGGDVMPMSDLAGRKVFAFCGIGNPLGFDAQLERSGASLVGSRHFGDHHDYTSADLQAVRAEAAARGAQMLLTTAKDWVKLQRFDVRDVWKVELSVRLQMEDEAELLEQINLAISS